MYICFEGSEGSGKSTQARLLTQYLIEKEYNVLLTKEPGSEHDPVCHKIREVLLHHTGTISNRAELLLFEADRAQHVDEVLLKASRNRYDFAISDRFDASSVAYQIYGRNVVSQEIFDVINNFAKKYFSFDFTFWIDVPPKIGLERGKRLGKSDRFQREDLVFHEKVRKGYKKHFMKLKPKNAWRKIDGTLSIDEVQRIVRGIIKERFM